MEQKILCVGRTLSAAGSGGATLLIVIG